MTVRAILCVFVITSVMYTDAGIIPHLPSFPSFSFSIPFGEARGWYSLPDFGKIWKFWTDLPQQATNFITKQIKDLLNYDPAPNWVPDPEQFGETEENNETIIKKQNITDLTGQSSENRLARRRSFNTTEDEIDREDEKEDKNYIPKEEKGNLYGLGREVIRSITDTFSSITTGLDTDKSFFSGLLNEFKDKVKAIYPGTQWCGDGNIARTKKHLGFFRTTDNCCRQHDNCSDYIEKEDSKYNLTNKGLFTRSHCDCDKKFYNCLKAANDMISTQIGTAYFTVLGPQCFKYEHPIQYCRIQVGLTNRCIEYELDYTKEKLYQWFDNPEY